MGSRSATTSLVQNRNLRYPVSSMSDQLDEVCKLVKRIEQKVLPDWRPDILKAITKAAPTCEPYTRFFFSWVEKTQPNLIVETGTDMGRSAIHLAMGWSEAKVVSIDVAPHCTEKLRSFGLGNVEAITANSVEASSNFADGSIDLLFLDSLHTYAHVSKELALFVPKVRKGGLVFMDDIHLGEEMERVWSEITQPKREISALHFTGFGVFEV